MVPYKERSDARVQPEKRYTLEWVKYILHRDESVNYNRATSQKLGTD